MSDIHIHNYDSGRKPEAGEKTWNTPELQQDFEVLGFSAPFIAVRRKSDGMYGTLEFTHSPRVYFDFKPGAR